MQFPTPLPVESPDPLDTKPMEATISLHVILPPEAPVYIAKLYPDVFLFRNENLCRAHLASIDEFVRRDKDQFLFEAWQTFLKPIAICVDGTTWHEQTANPFFAFPAVYHEYDVLVYTSACSIMPLRAVPYDKALKAPCGCIYGELLDEEASYGEAVQKARDYLAKLAKEQEYHQHNQHN